MTPNQARSIVLSAAKSLSEDQKARIRFHLRSGDPIGDICSAAASLDTRFVPALEREKAADAMSAGVGSMMSFCSNVHGVQGDCALLLYVAQKKVEENGDLRSILEDATR